MPAATAKATASDSGTAVSRRSTTVATVDRLVARRRVPSTAASRPVTRTDSGQATSRTAAVTGAMTDGTTVTTAATTAGTTETIAVTTAGIAGMTAAMTAGIDGTTTMTSKLYQIEVFERGANVKFAPRLRLERDCRLARANEAVK